jgi:hypothetical protein
MKLEKIERRVPLEDDERKDDRNGTFQSAKSQKGWWQEWVQQPTTFLIGLGQLTAENHVIL